MNRFKGDKEQNTGRPTQGAISHRLLAFCSLPLLKFNPGFKSVMRLLPPTYRARFGCQFPFAFALKHTIFATTHFMQISVIFKSALSSP